MSSTKSRSLCQGLCQACKRSFESQTLIRSQCMLDMQAGAWFSCPCSGCNAMIACVCTQANNGRCPNEPTYSMSVAAPELQPCSLSGMPLPAGLRAA